MAKTPHSELLDKAIAAGIVVKGGGGWLSFGDHKLGQGIENATARLAEEENSGVVAAIEGAVAATNQGGDDARQPGAAVKQPRKRGKGELREFPVLSPLKHDGETYEIGGTVELDRTLFLHLKASGVVSGDWPAEDLPAS